jgi:hypothetical protein
MGMFDTYGGIQLKVGPRLLRDWKVGDKVEETEDGAYLSHDGVVVIKDSTLIATFDKLTDKWGKAYNPEKLLHLLTSPTFKILYGDKDVS